jgi:YbbR domain-containing protein
MRLPFTIDIGRAAFAVALAIVLYFVALSETNPENRAPVPNVTVPVRVVNVPSGLVNTTELPRVSVWVRAPRSVFNRLRAESFDATIDATSAQPGENQGMPIVVTSSDPDVREPSADPGTINLRLDELRGQALPVRVNLTGQVPQGYLLGDPSSDPQRVTVTGPSSLVGRAVEAVVDVSVERLTVSINSVYTPRIVDRTGADLRDLNLGATPPAITVSVPITQQTQYKEVGVRVLTVGVPAAGYALLPLQVNPPTATLFGDPADLAAANFVNTRPVDVSGISSTTVRSVALEPPTPRTPLLQPGQSVTVTIQVSTLTVSQTLRVPPSVINLTGNMQLIRTPDSVSVTVSGPAPAMATLALNPRDFRVVLDMSGKGAGRHDIEARVQSVPAGLALESVDPRTIQVDLRDAPPTPTPAPTAQPS